MTVTVTSHQSCQIRLTVTMTGFDQLQPVTTGIHMVVAQPSPASYPLLHITRPQDIHGGHSESSHRAYACKCVQAAQLPCHHTRHADWLQDCHITPLKTDDTLGTCTDCSGRSLHPHYNSGCCIVDTVYGLNSITGLNMYYN